MESIPHHQCFVYEGSPSDSIPSIGNAIREMLRRKYRCLYLNSEPMLDEMRVHLARAGVDLGRETQRASLILSSDREHLIDGSFDLPTMLKGLTGALEQALADGFAGLFATGDMSWEFGPEADFSQLMEYEWQLEKFFETHPQLSGVCQYHIESFPPEVIQLGLETHPAIFLNEELSTVNPRYVPPQRDAASPAPGV